MNETAFTIICSACVSCAMFLAIYKTLNEKPIDGKVVVAFLTFATVFAAMLQPDTSDGEPIMQALELRKIIGIVAKKAFRDMLRLALKV